MIRVKQKGSVLIIAMVLLLVMTLIGMAGIEVTGLEERMVLNMRDRQAAFEAAEAALSQAETYLEKNAGVRIVNFADQNGNGGLYEFGGRDNCNDQKDEHVDSQGEDEVADASEAELTSTLQVWEKEWDANCSLGFAVSDNKSFAQLVATPRYIIEELNESRISDSESLGSGDSQESYFYYRITVMAKGLTDTTEVRLQTVYKVKR